MAVPDLARDELRRFCDAHTPAHMRDQMRLEATIRGNSITIADWRPLWPDKPGDWVSTNVAQLRYDPEDGRWTLYWPDRNSRWHRYDGLLPTTDLAEVLAEINADPTCIFWG
jgi:hypothetical protein